MVKAQDLVHFTGWKMANGTYPMHSEFYSCIESITMGEIYNMKIATVGDVVACMNDKGEWNTVRCTAALKLLHDMVSTWSLFY